MSGRDLKAESAEAQKTLFAAVEELRTIERETIPALRKTIANARGRNQQAGYERQKLEQIAASKPWLVLHLPKLRRSKRTPRAPHHGGETCKPRKPFNCEIPRVA